MTPNDLVRSVDRLSNNDAFGLNTQELLAAFSKAPRPKTAIGKEYLSASEVRRFGPAILSGVNTRKT
jgi:hypothetical protein